MAPNTVYDPVLGRNIVWRPLSGRTTERRVVGALGDQAFPRLGAFGACGNLNDPGYRSWRDDILFPVLSIYGVSEADVFNPEVRKWSRRRAVVESIEMARDGVVIVPVTNRTRGPASLAELGLAVCGGALRGQEIVTYIELDDGTLDDSRIARMLALMALKAAAERYPLFTLCNSMDQLVHTAGVATKKVLDRHGSGLHVHTEYAIPARDSLLEPAIYLSGTSGTTEPEWLRFMRHAIASFAGEDVPVADSYVPPHVWDNDPEGCAASELRYKTDVAVQLIAITGHAESIGALAEIGPRMLNALMSGQSLGVYIEPHGSAPDSETNRTRTLVLEHLARLREDFPGLQVYVADSLRKLAVFGLHELDRHRMQQATSALS